VGGDFKIISASSPQNVPITCTPIINDTKYEFLFCG